MTDPRLHDDARRAFALACGAAAGSYVYRRQRRRRSVASSPLAGLSASQAVIVAKIAHVIGLVTMAVYAAYYVHTMMQF